MSKIDINNEIVLMRHVVRRARLHVIRKLIKQIKMLGVKKGDEKQREKYKRKGDKLGQELIVIKKIQDDEVSRFSITNERKLEDILTDLKSDAALCVSARLADHKIIKDRVNEFKKKFPNYEEHLGPGRRKLKKLKRKAGKLAKKEAKIIAASSEEKETVEQDSQNEIETSETDENKVDENLEETEVNPESELPEKTSIVGKHKVKSVSPDNKKRIKLEKKNSMIPKSKEKLDKSLLISTTNKASAVKSFARFLEEKDESNNDIIDETKLVLEKEVDSFFMTEDGAREYLSVVVPKLNVPENEEDEETRVEDRRSRNNRFFDKVDKFERPRHNNNNNNNSFARNDRFQENVRHSRVKDHKNVDARKSGNETMHPSWAAKKKEQEILKLGFQGKKIVFDDL